MLSINIFKCAKNNTIQVKIKNLKIKTIIYFKVIEVRESIKMAFDVTD